MVSLTDEIVLYASVYVIALYTVQRTRARDRFVTACAILFAVTATRITYNWPVTSVQIDPLEAFVKFIHEGGSESCFLSRLALFDSKENLSSIVDVKEAVAKIGEMVFSSIAHCSVEK